MHTTTRRVSAVLSLFAAFLLAGACGKLSQPKVTAYWAYDEARTIQRAGTAGPKLKETLSGMVIDLQFFDDNTFSLTIKGGPEPTVATGTFKPGYGGITLVKKVIDGKPVTGIESHFKSPDRASLEMSMANSTVILMRR